MVFIQNKCYILQCGCQKCAFCMYFKLLENVELTKHNFRAPSKAMALQPEQLTDCGTEEVVSVVSKGLIRVLTNDVEMLSCKTSASSTLYTAVLILEVFILENDDYTFLEPLLVLKRRVRRRYFKILTIVPFNNWVIVNFLIHTRCTLILTSTSRFQVAPQTYNTLGVCHRKLQNRNTAGVSTLQP